MWKGILLALGLVIAGLLIFAAVKPKAFSIQRSVLIRASPARIFSLIDDLHAFNTWNPFAKEQGIKIAYGARTQGNDAVYDWAGAESGVGQMRIIESAPPQRVAMQLDFMKPFEAHNTAVFSIAPQNADATQVTWTMSGNMPYSHRLMTIFFNMDKTVGAQFELGLESLKSLAEKPQ